MPPELAVYRRTTMWIWISILGYNLMLSAPYPSLCSESSCLLSRCFECVT